MDVLAFGAHGDDLEAFCGGTLARYAQAGHRVVMCVVTDGRANPMGNPDEIAAVRKAEAQASADVIGAKLVWLAIPDGGLMVDEATRRLFVDTIRGSTPDVIITHPPDDYHPDHTATSQLVIEAVQCARAPNYPSTLMPIPYSIPVAFMDSEHGINFSPEDYVDISDVWETKMKMLQQHRSQCMPGHTYEPDVVLPPADQISLIRDARIISEFRGLSCGVTYAEGFRWWRVAYRIVPKRMLP